MLAGLGAFVNLSSTLSHQAQSTAVDPHVAIQPSGIPLSTVTRASSCSSLVQLTAQLLGVENFLPPPHKHNRLRLRVWAPAWLEHGMSVEFHFSASACLFQLSSS